MKAISPVIATVIIVSVAIAISIAVALWLTGITSGFTGLEKLEVVSAYAKKNDINNADTFVTIDSSKYHFNFTIEVTVRNTGTGAATIQEIFINGKPYNAANAYVESGIIGLTLDPGQEKTFEIYLGCTNGTSYNNVGSQPSVIRGSDRYFSGQTVEIKIHTAAGKDYPKAVTLP